MKIPPQDSEPLPRNKKLWAKFGKTFNAFRMFRDIVRAMPASSEKDLPLATMKVSGAKFSKKKKRKAEKFIHFHYGRTAK